MTERGQHSLWRDTAGIDLSTARQRAARLEHRARAEDEIAARDAYLGLLGISPGEKVLDVGCGSGAVTREVARRVGDTGSVVGLDPSPAFLEVARELAQEAGVAERMTFQEGSALALPFADGTFDVVTCVTVLAHTPGGQAAVPEMVRVLRPGGRLGVFDLDTDMTTFTHPDRALTRRIVAAAADATTVNGWIGRELPGLFARAGLEDIRVRGFFPLETSVDSFYGSMAERCADAAVQAGSISEAEKQAWLAAFRAEGAAGPIVAGRLHIFAWGRKPR